MESINFNQNIKTYAINGDESNVVKINTSDYGIFSRAKEKAQELASLEKMATDSESEDNLTKMEEVEKLVRNLLNYIFNADVCTPAFGNVNCLSPCDGVPMFVGFFNAFMEILQEEMLTESKKMQANVSKYTNQLPHLAK